MTVHPAHERVLTGPHDVPVTRVNLTNGDTFDRYCTSGPGSDPEVGLPGLRLDWIVGRGDSQEYDGRRTQLLDNGRGAVRRGSAREWSATSSWSAPRSRPAARSSPRTSTIPSPSRWSSAGSSW